MLITIMMSMYYTAAKGLLMSLFLPPETMLRSMASADARARYKYMI